jgi:signal transduction histidine kinase
MRHEDALVGVAVVLYDITRFRLMDDLKTNLLATVSHELKTPLTSVRMALHILSEKTVGPLTSQQHDLVSMARTEAERLLGILNDLLDLTRLEDGNARLHKEKVPAATLVRKVTEESRDAVSARNLKLRCAVEPELPEVWVDRQRISHVFTNFISNAVSHSPEGAEILLRAARTTEGGVQFSVIDQGPGIPEEYQVRIFDRFFRVPGQARAGAGLGLSIAREITLAHGGRIGVKSQPGRGSEFFFILAGAAREEQHEEAVAAQAN